MLEDRSIVAHSEDRVEVKVDMRSNAAASRFSSIDELLGDSRGRFFGAGYRLVRHEVTGAVVDPAARTTRASARIEYPAAWSIKQTGELKPHLSTLDAFVLGAQLCEAHVRTAFGIDGDAADRLWLAYTGLKPSNTPTLDLAAVPARCTLLKTERAPGSLCGHLSSFAAQVGSIGLEFVIDHPMGTPREGAASWANLDELLGPPEERYYGSAYMATQVVLREIELDSTGERVRALIDLEDPPELPRLRGMGAAYFPFVSGPDVVIGFAQLAQALMYRYDGVTRDVSHNLWMRRVALHSGAPVGTRRGLPGETWSTKLSLLPIKDTRWRSGSFALTVPGVTGEYNLAHQLPTAQPAGPIARARAANDKDQLP